MLIKLSTVFDLPCAKCTTPLHAPGGALSSMSILQRVATKRFHESTSIGSTTIKSGWASDEWPRAPPQSAHPSPSSGPRAVFITGTPKQSTLQGNITCHALSYRLANSDWCRSKKPRSGSLFVNPTDFGQTKLVYKRCLTTLPSFVPKPTSLRRELKSQVEIQSIPATTPTSSLDFSIGAFARMPRIQQPVKRTKVL